MRFQRNAPIEITQPTVVVDAGLPPGTHRFQLVVVDEAGNRSRPAEVVVKITAIRQGGIVPGTGGGGSRDDGR
jgi:hypothetical protein